MKKWVEFMEDKEVHLKEFRRRHGLGNLGRVASSQEDNFDSDDE